MECPNESYFMNISFTKPTMTVFLGPFCFLNWTGDFVLLKNQEVEDCIFLVPKTTVSMINYFLRL